MRSWCYHPRTMTTETTRTRPLDDPDEASSGVRPTSATSDAGAGNRDEAAAEISRLRAENLRLVIALQIERSRRASDGHDTLSDRVRQW